MYNKVKKSQDKLDKARDAKCIPLAKEYLQAILDGNVSLDGNLSEDKLVKEYEPIVVRLLERFLEADLSMDEVMYIKKLVLEMIDNVDMLLISSVNNTLKIAETRFWGCSKDELTLKKLDQVIHDTNPKTS